MTASGVGVFGAIGFYKNDEKFYRKIVMPVIHCLDPEDAHKLAIWVGKHRLIPRNRYVDPDVLVSVVVCGTLLDLIYFVLFYRK